MPSYRITTKKTWDQTLDDLAEQFRLWGVSSWTVDPVRPRHAINQWNNTEALRAVTLRYQLRDRDVVLTMSKQARAHDNLRVLYLAVEAMRLNEARGIAEVVASAYAQLPPAGGTTPGTAMAETSDPYAVLGVERSYALDVIESIWKARLRAAHPDHGGKQEDAARLNAAMAAIRKEKQNA